MENMRPTNLQEKCPSCGAPIVSEICAYCGAATGLNTARADMEYPVLECKSATLNFWKACFPAIFAVTFSIAGIICMICGITDGEIIVFFAGIPFLLVGIVASVIIVMNLSRYIKVKKNGKQIQATVYGYMNDDVLINNEPAQIVKLLVHTPNGPRFILYKLGNTLKPYGINDTIPIMVYEDCFLICKNKEVIKW